MGLKRALKRAQGMIAMNVGQIASAKPLSRYWGWERGTPIDRYYIDRFLESHLDDIRGHVLEVGDDGYSRRFGGAAIDRQDVVDIDRKNPAATIVGDLQDPSLLLDSEFDCILLPQTLQFIPDPGRAIENLRRALRPGGVLLLTAPAVTAFLTEGDYPILSAFHPALLEFMLQRSFDRSNISVQAHGNLFAATALLHGAVVEEIPERKLNHSDSHYPVIVTARAIA